MLLLLFSLATWWFLARFRRFGARAGRLGTRSRWLGTRRGWFGDRSSWLCARASQKLPIVGHSEETGSTHDDNVLQVVGVFGSADGVPALSWFWQVLRAVEVKNSFIVLLYTKIFVFFQNLSLDFKNLRKLPFFNLIFKKKNNFSKTCHSILKINTYCSSLI